MKNLFLLFALFGMFTFAACGGEAEEDALEEDEVEVVDEVDEEMDVDVEEPVVDEIDPTVTDSMAVDSMDMEVEEMEEVEE